MIRAWLVPAGLLGFLGVLIVYPMLLLLTRGIGLDTLQSTYIFTRLLQTLLQAALSSLLVFGLSLLCGPLLGRYRFWGKPLLEAWLGVPFVVPVMVAGLGFLAIFGARGLVKLEGTLALVLLANLFYNLGTAVRLTMNAPYSPELEMVARLEGANSWQVWCIVSLPVALPFALVGSGFAFLYSFASFAVPLLLGGSQFATLEVEMYQAVQRLELEDASALALLQAGLMLIFGWALLHLERATSQPALWQQQKPLARGATRALVGFVVFGLLVLTTLPLLAVLWRSLSGVDGLTLRHYIRLLENAEVLLLAFGNNIGFATLTLLFVVPLAVLFANFIWQRNNRFFDLFSLLPLAVSSTVLGVGLIVAYPFWAAQLPLLIAVYALQALPLVTRAML
ncbi:MAG: ABC transporter permease, partial [Deinococcales bacterium]